MKRSSTKRKDDGYVMVLLGLGITVLMLIIGFAVDLGSWYLAASKLQRASDAAALAGSAKLPSADEAQAAAMAVYKRNGLQNGVDGVNISFDINADSLSTQATDTDVPAYFTQSVRERLSISRSSFARRNSAVPTLGSPFNVLGSGDLDLGIPKQNFWLALNGVCSPKEDGDFFSALYDKNKGPFLGSRDASGNFNSAPTGRHTCPDSDSKKNLEHNPAGYSYYIDIPKAPTPNGVVDIKVYDPAFNNNPGSNYPDQSIGLAQDATYAIGDIIFDLWNTNGTTETNDDTRLLPHPIAVDTADVRTPPGQWWNLATLPHSLIADGGQFRVQVIARESYLDNRIRGVNSFAIGAFPSWRPALKGCDSRDKTLSCPRVYGRNAISTFNNLNASDGKVSFYFADVHPTYTGSNFDIELWDPGEGVEKIELLAPNGTPLHFDWSASDGGGSDQNVTFIQTDIVENPARAGLSNPYKFNDRLVTINATIPADYADMVAAADGDTWLRIRYTVSSAPNDRTTWGITIAGGSSGAPYLDRKPQ